MKSIKHLVKPNPESSILKQISKHTVVSVDSQDFETTDSLIKQHSLKFHNATSNQSTLYNHWLNHPDVLLNAVKLVNSEYSTTESTPNSTMDTEFQNYLNDILFKATALTSSKLLTRINGYVLIQIQPSLSYKRDSIIDYVEKQLTEFNKLGINKDKVILKVPTTFESMKAAAILKSKYRIKVCASLVYSMFQVILAVESKAEYIQVYVDPLDSLLDVSQYVKIPNDLNPGLDLAKKTHDYLRGKHILYTKLIVSGFVDINTVFGVIGVDEISLSSYMIHKLLVVDNVDFNKWPVIKASPGKQDMEELGDLCEVKFDDDEELYLRYFEKDHDAKTLLKDAIIRFEDFHEKIKMLITNLLLEIGAVE